MSAYAGRDMNSHMTMKKSRSETHRTPYIPARKQRYEGQKPSILAVLTCSMYLPAYTPHSKPMNSTHSDSKALSQSKCTDRLLWTKPSLNSRNSSGPPASAMPIAAFMARTSATPMLRTASQAHIRRARMNTVARIAPTTKATKTHTTAVSAVTWITFPRTG